MKFDPKGQWPLYTLPPPGMRARKEEKLFSKNNKPLAIVHRTGRGHPTIPPGWGFTEKLSPLPHRWNSADGRIVPSENAFLPTKRPSRRNDDGALIDHYTGSSSPFFCWVTKRDGRLIDATPPPRGHAAHFVHRRGLPPLHSGVFGDYGDISSVALK